MDSRGQRYSALEIQNWLVEKLAEIARMKPGEIDVHKPFASYGIDSVMAVAISGDLEEWLGRRFPATLIYDYSNIAVLARYLAEEH